MAYLLTLAEYKAMFGVSDTTNDTQITALIPVVDDWVNGYLFGDSGTLVTATCDEVYNGTGNTFLRLRVKPITSITSITFGYNTSNAVTFSGSDFIYEADKALVHFDPSSTSAGLPGHFPCGTQNIRVVYVAGYATADVPPSIKYAAALHIYRMLSQTQVNPLASKEVLDQYSVVYADQATSSTSMTQPAKDILDILDGFKPVKYVF